MSTYESIAIITATVCTAILVVWTLTLTRRARLIAEGEKHMTAALQALTSQVEATTAVQQAAAHAIAELAAGFAAVKDDPAKIQALADQLKASSDALAAAVASAPAAPAPAPAA